ncbi:MAG: SDR family oxidoreductase [Dongiaceae bacterium]
MGILKDKVVLIVSETSEMAKDATSLFVEQGAYVTFLNAATSTDRDLKRLVMSDRKYADFVPVDFDEPESIQTAAREVVDRFGRLDCVFNIVSSAGPGPSAGHQASISTDCDNYGDRWTTLLRFQLPIMLPQGFGSIVFAETSATAPKSDIAATIREASGIGGGSGIRVNAIRPKMQAAGSTDRRRDRFASAFPAPASGRIVGNGFSQAALFLLSDLASFLNGLVLMVDDTTGHSNYIDHATADRAEYPIRRNYPPRSLAIGKGSANR